MKKSYDAVIVGSGIAGLYAALHLEQELSVLVLSKQSFMTNNTSLAQGGIAAVLDQEHDSTDAHFNDTLIAGGFKNNTDTVKILVEEGPEEVRKLIDYGVDFDQKDGRMHFTLEGGHSAPRILHHKDSTGHEVAQKLIQQVQCRDNIDIVENCIVCEIKKQGQFYLELLRGNTASVISTPLCIIATGGIGRAFEYTTNAKSATGDGITLAYRLGAKVKNIHMIQFHPTGLANRQTRETFLISEAVRGEGAYLLNCNGERFLSRYDDRMELAPRDVVSRSMMEEEKRTGSSDFYLDITHRDAQTIKTRFPLIYENLMERGVDMTRERIPVYPCQHYLMGGIEVDENGKTAIDGLYAVGECSHTGVHGNNRLASNSLLEALVFSRRASTEINRLSPGPKKAAPPEANWFPAANGDSIPEGIRTEVRAIMQKACFVIPNKAEIVKGYERIRELKNLLETGNWQLSVDFVEARSLITVAYLILEELL